MRVVVAILLLFACAPRENASPPAQPRPQTQSQSKPAPQPLVATTEEFRGTYSEADESETFVPCGKKEVWWVYFSDSARATLRKNNITGWGNWPMRVRGTLSPPGHYGHQGGYPRHLYVEQVIATGRPEGC